MNEPDSLADQIRRAQHGDEAALRVVFDATYQELRTRARGFAAVHRTPCWTPPRWCTRPIYAVADSGRLHIGDRRHFLRYASHVVRSVIVDFVRERIAQRRGGDAQHVTLDSEVVALDGAGEEEILNVHEALEELAHHDARLVQVVEMRYFAGVTESEVAAALEVTERTVRRDWQKAKLWLAVALK